MPLETLKPAENGRALKVLENSWRCILEHPKLQRATPPEAEAQKFSITFVSMPAGASRIHLERGSPSLFFLAESLVEPWGSKKMRFRMGRLGKRAMFLLFTRSPVTLFTVFLPFFQRNFCEIS